MQFDAPHFRRDDHRGDDSQPVWLPGLLLFLVMTCGSAMAQRSAEPDIDLHQLASAARSAAQGMGSSIVQVETLGGLEKVEGFLVGTAPTSGLVVDERGYVISSAFNFKHAPTAILVTLADGTKKPARIVARDTNRMLVLLKFDSDQPLPVPQAVPKQEIAVGQWALALGKTYDIQQPSISIGIVSATNRIWGRAIQTDAKTSPTNYGGPLVDLRGRVIGVIVPLSPDSSSEVAGADQYDGGIGFAIPMADIQQMLPRMIDGQDIAPGLLGVTVKQLDLYAQEVPEIAYCPPKSPAAKAGMKKGDLIVAINDLPVTSYAAMKHALGPHNAGDTVRVLAKRSDQQLEFDITLVDKVDPYLMPFLGVIPQRGATFGARKKGGDATDDASVPLRIAHVFEDSPADQAGLKSGDQLLALFDKQPKSIAEWRYELALQQPGDTIRLRLLRDGKPQDVDVELQSVPETVVASVPSVVELQGPGRDGVEAAEDATKVATGWLELKLPAEPNVCFALVPENYSTAVPHGLLIVIGLPGKVDQRQATERWGGFCESENFIVVFPQSLDEQSWQRSESDMIRKFANRLAKTYAIDRNRVAAFGTQMGGAMAYRFTFDNRDLLRAVATVDAVLPLGIELRGNDPVERLEVYSLAFKQSKLFPRIEANAEALRDRLKFPVIRKWLDGGPRELDASEFAEISRWLTSLDHL